MRIEETNAVLGIDVEPATDKRILARALEFCDEMADCYEADTMENLAFGALWYALCHVISSHEGGAK